MPKKPPASEVDVQAGLRLRAVRIAACKEWDLTQEQFATSIGVTRPALANWEGGRLPDARAMVRLHNWLGVSLDWIYIGDLRGVPYGLAVLIQREAERLGVPFHGAVVQTAQTQVGRTGLPAPAAA